jgi:subtilisin
MPEARKRYSIVFHDQAIDSRQVADLIARPSHQVLNDLSLMNTVGEPHTDDIHHLDGLGISYAWLALDDVVRLRESGAVSSIAATRLYQTKAKLLSLQAPLAAALAWNLAAVKADQAWNTATGRGVKVAVLDNGISKTHPDLTVAGGVSFVPNIADWDDDDGHGTHCAGIVAARRNDVQGTGGVAPDCSLYAVKVMTHGTGQDEWIIKGMAWAKDNAMDVVSMSLWHVADATSPTPDEPPDADFERAAMALMAANCLVIGIVGNGGALANHWVTNPGRCPNFFAIGGVDRTLNWWNESSYGPPALPVDESCEVVAPASPVRSTYLNGGYEYYQGTSQACPHVAGAAALVRQNRPQLTATQLRQILKATPQRANDPQFQDVQLGAGLLDCVRALAAPS